MAERLTIPRHTEESQRLAADPAHSVWVSANAGAGKTKVLSDRVLRLLLQGVHPGRILCLTYTNAAAANMAIRIFNRLGQWVTLEEKTLTEELTKLEGTPPDRVRLDLARRLFARAIETPGGLKIETLHAFCQRLLHLVPFEANVPARFELLDEAKSTTFLNEAIAAMLATAARNEHSALSQALDVVSTKVSGDALNKLLIEAVRKQDFIAQCREAGADNIFTHVKQAVGLPTSANLASLESHMLQQGLSRDEALSLIAELRLGKQTDEQRANALDMAFGTLSFEERLKAYLNVFFDSKNQPRAPAKIVTKSVPEQVRERLVREGERLTPLLRQWHNLHIVAQSQALFTLALDVHTRYEQRKITANSLDFDDLISKTLALLTRDSAAWVLYRLDQGIDHVLLDEAQDTNPHQWEILRLITEDFAAGSGARSFTQRTIFAVGDPKQSIYSFQGAEPAQFEHYRTQWKQRWHGAELSFKDIRLTLSFRSANTVLSAVDAVFALPEHFKGLSFAEDALVKGTVHEAARRAAVGVVELWPLQRPSLEEHEDDAWAQPVDAVAASAPAVLVARRIAQAIRHWIKAGDESGRVFQPQDILILVRKRNSAFEAVIRALKDADVPVAGADRLEITSHIAVIDLIAAGHVALLPEDDLNLASVLKSPLIGFDEEALFRIAAKRDEAQSLYAALQQAADEGDGAAYRAFTQITLWERLACQHGAFGFFAHMLGCLHGRAHLVARLGVEAGDAIDAFLSAAEAYEMTDTPSLTGFLAQFGAAPHVIKRDLEGESHAVRVMTVHGAKGLEAPIVIIIDPCTVSGQGREKKDALLPVRIKNIDVPLWNISKDNADPCFNEARIGAEEKALDEHNRLLYVAMTRARDRLVIAPYLGKSPKEPPDQAWFRMIENGLEATQKPLIVRNYPYGTSRLWHDEALTAFSQASQESEPSPAVLVPDWLSRPASFEHLPVSLRPSDAPAKPETEASYAARQRGTLIHFLLEHLPALPADQQRQAAFTYLRSRAPLLSLKDQSDYVEAALNLLHHPDLKELFSKEARAEVPLAGDILLPHASTAQKITGRIDRLVVREKDIIMADFKTGRPPAAHEDVPEAIVRQMQLYKALLKQLPFEGAVPPPIRAFVIWTQGAIVREIV
jgi:ATP-dependent helicase/nuclease subunit A